jgi:hypothetical protein
MNNNYLTTGQVYRLFLQYIPSLGSKKIIDWCEAGHMRSEFPGVGSQARRYAISPLELYRFVNQDLTGISELAKQGLLGEIKRLCRGEIKPRATQRSACQLSLFV